MEFIRGTTLVHLKIRCWSGEIKAERDTDVQVGKDGRILPKKLLDLGRKKIFPPNALQPMQNQRKAAERGCLLKGTRFMGGFAVPDGDVDEAIAQIDAAQAKFDLHVTEFMDNFEANRQAWIDDEENKEFADILNRQVPDKETVKAAFHFSYKLFKLDPVEGFEPEESEISQQIFHELGLECKDMAKGLLDRKSATSGDTLKKRLDPFIERLDALSFGNSRILTVLGEFRALRDSIPLERIDKDHIKFGQTVTFLKMASDSDTLEQIIDGSFSVTGMINALTQQAAPPVQSPAEGTPAPATAPAFAPAIAPPAQTVTGMYF